MANLGPNIGPLPLRLDDSITKERVKPGTFQRILPFVRRHRRPLAVLVVMTAIDAVITAASPLILKLIIDEGILPKRMDLVVWLSLLVAGLAVVDAGAVYVQTWFSGRVGQGIIFDLRTRLFSHVQQQPLAFFSRTQTGALVSRLNNDVIGAQQAVTSLLSQMVSAVLTLLLVLAAMLYLSWQITLAALLIVPTFVLVGKVIGRRLQRLTREGMQIEAEMGSLANERFNVSGAMLAKLYGRPETENARFADRSARVRDIAVSVLLHSRAFMIIVGLLTALTTAAVYGIGGALAVDGTLQIGALVALVTLLMRLYAPINQLSGMQIDVMTALVSFDRVFEVLDLKPLIVERPDARPLPPLAPGTAPGIEFDDVSFRYPKPDEVSLASLEAIALRGQDPGAETRILHGVSFRVEPGRLTALVGPSGAGKTTIAQLVSRLYDPMSGAVRIGGHDVRDLTTATLRDAVGVVTQDAHLFHDTIRANLLYARPDATEPELVEACKAARIWKTISSLSDGLDTVVGDRGYRLSGGEKQRVALARLLVKSPPIVVLDEATAHLDSESELAIQRALKTALAGRTSLVIAHRLSTIREADQILVVDGGTVRERGTHWELLTRNGVYAELNRTQFAGHQPVPLP